VNRPFYPCLGFVLSKTLPFVPLLTLLRAANLVLIYLMLYLFYKLLLFFTPDRHVIFCAVFLLATAPAITVYGPQPVPEVLVFFSIALLSYLAAYLDHIGLNVLRVVLFALLHGMVLLIKENVALVFIFFVLLLWIKQYRRALLYLLIVPVPYVIWMGIVRYVLRSEFAVPEVASYGFVAWLMQDFARAGVLEQVRIVARWLARFGWHLLKGFVFVPVILSLLGVARSRLSGRWLLYSLHMASYFVMFFAMNLISPRMTFMLYPVILFFAAEEWRGMSLGERKPSFSRQLLFLIPLLVFAILTSLDVYRLYYYG
jgi:hypothetical protein